MSSYFGLTDNKGVYLDLKLDILFKQKTNGFYIELGANNGLLQSNTAFFERNRGWKGILIEPCEQNYNLCKINRPNSICYNCACVSSEYKQNTISGDFIIRDTDNIYDSLLFSVNSIRRKQNNNSNVKALTLEKILDNENINWEIDLLSLDVEGYELEVLKGLNFDKYKPKVLLIEIYNFNYNETIKYLSNYNYILISNFSNYNHIDTPGWDGTYNDFLFVLNTINI